MGGDDKINIKGSSRKGSLVRIIGGEGKDTIIDKSSVKGICKKNIVYDEKEKTEIKAGSETADRTSGAENINDYDYYSYKYNVVAPATFFGYSKDDGIFLGGGILIKTYGFRKKPYANLQRIVANFSVLEKSFNLKYNGEINDVIGKWGLLTELNLLAPSSSTNFFGLGNETKKLDVPDSFYRLRYDDISFYAGLKRRIGRHHSLDAGPIAEYIKIENTSGRYITTDEGSSYISDFTARNYVGLKATYRFQHIDDSVLTFRGINWVTTLKTQSEFDDMQKYTTNIETAVSVYIPLGNRSTLAVRTGLATRVGDFEFFQANTLGGQNIIRESGNLRGYLRSRYAGRTAAYMNTEFRAKLLRFKTYLFPAHLGLLAFYDQGRVWTDNEKSSSIHSGYGGGLWIDPFTLAVINFTYAVSKEEKLFSIGIGFLF
jgi:hypothetical protein